MPFFSEKLFSPMKTSDIFVENLVNKKLLVAAFYHLTYQEIIYKYVQWIASTLII